MDVIKKIMVAVDVSDYSLPSLRYARQLALAIGAKLMVVNVVNERDIRAIQNALDTFDPTISQGHIEDRINDRREWLDALIHQVDAEKITVSRLVRVGVPYHELLKAIEDDGPDLLVMGTKGRSNLADTILGSCARKMFRRSPIPLLSLRPEKESSGE